MYQKSIFILLMIVVIQSGISSANKSPNLPTSKLKEITLAIEHNSEDKHDDSKNSTLSHKTKADLLINSKLIYAPGAKRAAAFNQGILKFQQLLDLPINSTLEEFEEIINSNSTNVNSTETGMNMEENANTTLTTDPSKVLMKKFIEDFENSSEEMKNETMLNSSNMTNTVSFNATNTNETKSSIEILDEDNENVSNKTNSTIANQTSTYLPTKIRAIDVKPQTVQEIPLDSFKNRASGKRTEDQDEISQNIKRDILLGNLNPFFSNPSTSSIRNTNSLFFDDVITTSPRSGSLFSAIMNPFEVNTFAQASPARFTNNLSRTRASPLKNSPLSASGSVETLQSISLDDTKKPPTFAANSFSANSGKTSVRTVPALLLNQDDRKQKFSSKYKTRTASAVSSTSFSFTPSGGSHRRKNNSFRSKNRKPVEAKTFAAPSFNPSPSKPPASPESAESVEILKSVDYELPEEVGKSLAKTGLPSKTKRTTVEDFKIQKSVTMDPVMLSLDMEDAQEYSTKQNIVRKSRLEFKPSTPDRKTRKMREFSRFRKRPTTTENYPTSSENYPMSFFESMSFEDSDGKNDILESDIIFKPHFATKSPRKFGMPETTSFKYPFEDELFE